MLSKRDSHLILLEEDWAAYHARWAELKRQCNYRSDWVKYIEMERPKLKESTARDHDNSGIPCPQGIMIDEKHLCRTCWEENKEDERDRLEQYQDVRRKSLEPKKNIVREMIGGFVKGDCEPSIYS